MAHNKRIFTCVCVYIFLFLIWDFIQRLCGGGEGGGRERRKKTPIISPSTRNFDCVIKNKYVFNPQNIPLLSYIIMICGLCVCMPVPARHEHHSRH